MAKKKNSNQIGYGKPIEVTVEYLPGAVVVDSPERARDVLVQMEEALEAIKPIQEYISRAREMVTDYARTHAVDVIQLDDHYWRKIIRKSRFFVATPGQMPMPKPKCAKSLKEICKGKKAAFDKPVWNFITKRVVDTDRLQLAVEKGYLTEKEVEAAYIESEQKPFIQRFNGVAGEGDDDDG